MIIIVEGPDNSGKSTLIEKLTKLPGLSYVPMLSGRTQAHEVSRKVLYDVIYEHPGKLILCERFYPISDTIYRSMDNGPRIFSKVECHSIFTNLWARDKVLGRIQSRLIYCRPPLEAAEAAKHVSSNDDDDKWVNFILPRLQESFSLYDRATAHLASLGVPVIHYDYTVPWSYEVVERVINDVRS